MEETTIKNYKENSKIVTDITRSTRNYDIDRFFEQKAKVFNIGATEFKKLYYSMEYAILQSINDLIDIKEFYEESEVAAVIANRAFYNFTKSMTY